MSGNPHFWGDALFKIEQAIHDEFMGTPSRFKIERIAQVTEFYINDGYVYYIINNDIIQIFNSEKRLLGLSKHNHLLGLVSLFGYKSRETSLTSLKNLVVYKIDDKTFSSLISKHNLWKQLSLILCFYINKSENTYSNVSYDSISNIVPKLIHEYKEIEPDENTISLNKFILSRCNISKSQLFNVMKSIKKTSHNKCEE
ncbi:TPA: hypothetical protein N3A31_001520 [Salmonella enterica subsp. houtenae serovar 43:z4,z32:-]|nr:hypothetical protein [Salmonella enterica]HCM1863651.1 hypothetical protein [Salmonella enterica subsp. houtenae serovar 43:z4,z32:-]EIG0989434.1 hypothetical protein [Salmonella enterica]EJP2996500.1 hypothetical protein [Salmonella enterica]EKT8863155.1 hypothetical protein [Salmonella enterica]